MPNMTTPITIALNKHFKGRCPRIQCVSIGSFISIRIEDKEGEVTVKMFTAVVQVARDLLIDAKLVPVHASVGQGSYYMDGCVHTWMTH